MITTTIDDVIRRLDEREIVNVVTAGIDKALGKGSARLVFKTLESVYHFNVTPLSIKTGEFDVLLCKLVGETGYHYIVQSVIIEMDATQRTGHHENS
jgi:hypothetical protein